MNSDGTNQRKLIPNEKFTGYHKPTWSPDGRYIALTYLLDEPGCYAICKVCISHADGSSAIFCPTEHFTSGSSAPSWSPDSQFFAFLWDIPINQGGGIFVTDISGTYLYRIAGGGEAAVIYSSPAWSPNGRVIAFSRMSDGFNISLVDADGTNLRELTKIQDGASCLTWSPDSRFIAFDSGQAIFLMNRPSVIEYYLTAQRKARDEILQQSEAYILGVNVDEYVDYLLAKYSLPVIERDNNRQLTYESKVEWRHGQNTFGDTVRHEGSYVQIEYPFVPKENLETALALRGSSWTYGVADWEYDSRGHKVILKTEQTEHYIREAISGLESNIGSINQAIIEQGKAFQTFLRETIEKRKQFVSQRKTNLEELINRIDIPLVPKSLDATPIINFDIKREIKALVEPTPQKREEYFLEKSKVLTVIHIIQKSGRGFEITPVVYAKLEEEELRSIILGALNTVFGGSATGETFSKLGKTDIHLQIPRGDILIAECKFWQGVENYHSTIAQLFRYLTWRQNYGIIITFSRNTDFTNVLQSVEQAVKSHPTYKSGFQPVSKTHFESLHRFPDDPQKTVEIHHLIFNLYTGAGVTEAKPRSGKSKQTRRTKKK